MCKCLYCYKPLADGEVDYHKTCARKIFGSTSVPTLPYTRDNIKDLAREIVTASTTVTGVQAKLSLDIARGNAGEPQRFTIVGLWGRYILKPQTDRFANLPENEDLTMHMAEVAGIKTVPHSLIRFADGELCYITRRMTAQRQAKRLRWKICVSSPSDLLKTNTKAHTSASPNLFVNIHPRRFLILSIFGKS